MGLAGEVHEQMELKLVMLPLLGSSAQNSPQEPAYGHLFHIDMGPSTGRDTPEVLFPPLFAQTNQYTAGIPDT